MLQKYREYFNIDPDFFAQVNEAVIETQPNIWQKYYPHATFVKLIKDTVSVLSRQQKLSIWVEGAYGTGKSYAVLTLKKLLDEIENNTKPTTYDDFNDCVKKKADTNLYKWQNVDKTFIRGKSNKGLDFEKIYETDFEARFKMDILAFLSSYGNNDVDWMHIPNVIPARVGDQNNKRTLYIGKHSFKNNDEDNPQSTEDLVDVLKVNPSLGDGKTLSDITLAITDADGKPIKDTVANVDGEVYLSLKSGNTVCFLSSGIRNDEGIKKEYFEKVDYDIINGSDEGELTNYLTEESKLFGNVANQIFI